MGQVASARAASGLRGRSRTPPPGGEARGARGLGPHGPGGAGLGHADADEWLDAGFPEQSAAAGPLLGATRDPDVLELIAHTAVQSRLEAEVRPYLGLVAEQLGSKAAPALATMLAGCPHHAYRPALAARVVFSVVGPGDGTGRLFRGDERPASLRDDVRVGPIHPALLSPRQRSRWRRSFEAAGIEQPFLQLDRPAVRPGELDLAALEARWVDVPTDAVLRLVRRGWRPVSLDETKWRWEQMERRLGEIAAEAQLLRYVVRISLSPAS